ncbi:MAG: TIGR04283 family arsenosugar biosynthesis glycosyltransferase [Psychroserpens sp.]|uniref:TIGR04283 family arsenosugar biosynthesis glycosyltransferase n=1 Tax=Psychroserpens sp. TaxID=2020870 RepID=UPI0030027B64
MSEISIIIPVLNEEKDIGKLLVLLNEHSSKSNISEIILVDGGSQDKTVKVINNVSSSGVERSQKGLNCARPDIKLLHSEKGRAKQMNLGAKKATSNILYFLHADSFPPQHFDTLIISEVKKGNQAGCFRMKFDSNHWWLRLASWLTQFSWRACRGGDQSQFITRELFDEIGGYDESFTIYEDNILINELYSRKQFVVINKKVQTSARLYKRHGIWKLQYHFWTIYVKKWFGASADDLFAYYKKHIC